MASLSQLVLFLVLALDLNGHQAKHCLLIISIEAIDLARSVHSDAMSPCKKSSGSRTQLIQYEGETDEDYRRRRERNNVAVRKCRKKTKTKTEEVRERVKNIFKENCILEGSIKSYRNTLQMLLQCAADGKVSADINIEALLEESYDLIGK